MVRPLLVVVAGLLSGCGAPERAERAVLVTIDTLRADHVGVYGSAAGATPTLDRLAARGVRFETVISPAPLTLPSHATMLTGLSPLGHGVHENSVFRLEPDVPFLPATLSETGFGTAAFVAAFVLDRQYGLARGFDHYDDRMGLRRAAATEGFAERRADVVVDAAIDWIGRAPERFFLWVHLYDPHANFDPPGEYAARFERPYLGEIAFADAEVARLLAALDARFPDGSLVAITSDHGESLGEHGELTHSLTLYEATQRVPWILAGPGVPPGRVVTGVATLADVAPTLAARLGVAFAPARAGDLDGRDLGPYLASGTLPADHVAYVETLTTRLSFGWSALYGVRTPRWKFIRAPRPELYDLDRDPGELRNLAADQPEQLAALDRRLDAILAGARPIIANRSPGSRERDQLAALGYVAAEDGAAVEPGEVSGLDPKDGLIYLSSWLKALELRHSGRPREALDRLREFSVGGPMLDLYRAETALDAEAFEEARSHARAALGARLEQAEVHVALGRALLGLGRVEEAAAAFEDALRRDPTSAEAGVGLARVSEARGNRPEARTRLERVIESRSGSIEAHWRLAALELEDGNEAAAARHLEELPVPERLRFPALKRLCAADLARGDRPGALRRVAAALQRGSRDPRILELRDELQATAND